jgi:UPF0176 protein
VTATHALAGFDDLDVKWSAGTGADFARLRVREEVVFDARNAFEVAIDHVWGAVVPATETTRDFVPLLDTGAYDHLKS